MLRRLCAALALCSVATAAHAVTWPPSTTVTVTNESRNADCSASHNPYEECTGSNAASPTLENWDGEDLLEAALSCEAAGGCTIQMGCHDFVNVGLDLATGAYTSGTGRDKKSGSSFSAGWQNGIVFMGEKPSASCPNGTRVYTKSTPGYHNEFSTVTQAAFYLHNWNPPGPTTAGITRFGFYNFTCDGQSNLGPARSTQAEPTTVDYHSCVQSRWDDSLPTFEYGEVRGLTIRSFTGSGIDLSNMAVGVITGNTVDRIGCWQDYGDALCVGAGDPFPCCMGATSGTCTSGTPNHTSVVGSAECGCDSGVADCNGWEREPELGPSSGGFKQVGFGIIFRGHGDVLIQGNSVSHATKYGSACHLDLGTTRTGDLCRIDSNTYTSNAEGAFAGTHCGNVSITRNHVVGNGMDGNSAEASSAIGSNGGCRTLEILNNDIDQSYGPGIRIWSWSTDDLTHPELRIEGNTISQTAQWADDQSLTVGTMAPISVDPHMSEPCPTDANREKHRTYATLIGNTVDGTNEGAGALSISQGMATCEGYYMDPLIISGSNSFYPSTWSGHNVLARIRSALNISATGVTLKTSGACTGGSKCQWQWLSGATGSCSGFTGESNTQVVDSSGVAIGTCGAP